MSNLKMTGEKMKKFENESYRIKKFYKTKKRNKNVLFLMR